jgi:response regulator of citrate/malate metabolism
MIQNMLNAPRTPDDWQIFSLSHARSHQEIRQAIQAQFGVALGDYVLDPINFEAVNEWLERVQQTHTEMNGVLGLQSNDLEWADLKDERQLSAWIYLNWQEDNAARVRLGI